MELTIQRAMLDDLPVLAELNRLTYLRETITQFAFTNWPDEDNMRNFFMARLGFRMKDADTEMFKAVDSATGEVVGFIGWTLEHGTEDRPSLGEPVLDPSAMAISDMPTFLNMKFVMETGAVMEALNRQMKKRRSYCEFRLDGTLLKGRFCWQWKDVSTFVVAPRHQRKGYGSQLMSHCLVISDKAGLPAWLISFPGSHDLYLRFGFEDVDHRDVDLNEWDNFKFRGFGIYRSYAMLRQPKISVAQS